MPVFVSGDMDRMDQEWSALIRNLAAALTERKLCCATAESCTGGMAGALLTSMPGSSVWYKGGIISYANEAKRDLLGVPEEALLRFGAVSEPVVRAMALGACRALHADLALSISGIAGPDGGLPGKPVGTVWLGWARQGQTRAVPRLYPGSREAVRRAAAWDALQGLLAWVA